MRQMASSTAAQKDTIAQEGQRPRFRVQLERIVHIQVIVTRTTVRCALKDRTVLVAQHQYQVLVLLATTVLQDLSLPHHNRAQQVLIEHLLLLPLKLHVLHALQVTIALSEAWVHLCCALQAIFALPALCRRHKACADPLLIIVLRAHRRHCLCQGGATAHH